MNLNLIFNSWKTTAISGMGALLVGAVHSVNPTMFTFWLAMGFIALFTLSIIVTGIKEDEARRENYDGS